MAYVINHPEFTPPNDMQVVFAFILFIIAEMGSVRSVEILSFDLKKMQSLKTFSTSELFRYS